VSITEHTAASKCSGIWNDPIEPNRINFQEIHGFSSQNEISEFFLFSWAFLPMVGDQSLLGPFLA
jgi:hypothetical protein